MNELDLLQLQTLLTDMLHSEIRRVASTLNENIRSDRMVTFRK